MAEASALFAKWDQLLRAELEKTYLTKETDLSLTHITLELIYGDHLGRDLVPFFQSPFRFTHLRRLLQWIETTSWVPTSPKQAYFYKSLRILSQLSKGFYIDVDDELGLPTANDLNQQFAHDLVQTRVSLCQIDGSFDLQAWKTVCEGCADSQLQAEQYIAVAMSLQHSERVSCYAEAWNILEYLLDKQDLDTTSRCYAVQQALAFLNRSKDREGVVDDTKAYPLIKKLSQELIAIGLKLQNVQLVCEGLFYYVRSQELHAGKKDYSEVLQYRAALEFVEQAQGRTVMRMQVLLTMGSIYRHFCREGELPWSEFRQNLDEGWGYYRRAYRSAFAHRHPRHMLNATSYLIDFCRKALRYADEKDARLAIRFKAEEAFSVCQQTEKELAGDVAGDKVKELFSTIRRGVPTLLYVLSVSEGEPASDKVALLRTSFKEQVETLAKRLNTKQDQESWRNTHKATKTFMTNLHRSLVYGENGYPVQYKHLLKELEPDIKRLLEVTYNNKSVSGEWSNIERRMPPSHYTAYNLTNSARAVLLNALPPRYEQRIIAHHVTHEYPVRYDANLPSRARIAVVGYAFDEGMDVAVVEVNGSLRRPDGKIYHVTISLDPTIRRPEDANVLLLKPWQSVQAFTLSVWPGRNPIG